MSTRINQEPVLIGTNTVTGSSNTRINQIAIMMLVPAVLQGLKVQIIGGPFQDALGNPLADGYLMMQLQHDAVVPTIGLVAGGIAVRVPLDGSGYVQGTVTGAPIYAWPNDILLPSGGTYIVWAYDASNRFVWDNPQIQSIKSTPSPFNINAWVPGP